MLSAHTVDQIRRAEEDVASRLPAGELMQRAAQGLRDAVLSTLGRQSRVVALVGPGNNGGDALFAVALLRRSGVLADVCLIDPSRIHQGGFAAAASAGAQTVDSLEGYDVVLDAVFGIGARAGLKAVAAQWALRLHESPATVIAVDLPSGLAADDPRLPDAFMRADVVVTFGTHKVSGLVDPAASVGGSVPRLIDIGLHGRLGAPRLEAYEAADCGQGLRTVSPHGNTQKYARGVVGVAAGSTQYAGAGHLCVAGALNGLCGMVRFVGPEELGRRIVDRAPEVVASRGRVQAWAVGSGAGENSANYVQMALSDEIPVVIDADGLSHLPGRFAAPAVLTPHAGELAAMMGTSRDAVEADPLAHVETAADRWNATVLLKGRRTLIATAGQTTRVNLTATAWLATAGSGDVLSGLAGSLLAAGADPHTAACIAAYVHGEAAHIPNPGGPITASMVAAAIPQAIATLLTKGTTP